jgi:hypothetical protein
MATVTPATQTAASRASRPDGFSFDTPEAGISGSIATAGLPDPVPPDDVPPDDVPPAVGSGVAVDGSVGSTGAAALRSSGRTADVSALVPR